MEELAAQGHAVARNWEDPLRILDHYLAFIHFFGFSINPKDDLQSRYLSIRVRRAAVAAAAASSTCGRVGEPAGRKLAVRERAREEHELASGQQETMGGASHAERLASLSWRTARALRLRAKQLNLLAKLRASRRFSLNRDRLKLGLKFYAIALTSFLTANHLVVLCDYIYHDSKAFIELMLELRLVITKLSALIFVLAWHRNQAKVRQLIRLVKSTSSYILAAGELHSPAVSLEGGPKTGRGTGTESGPQRGTGSGPSGATLGAAEGQPKQAEWPIIKGELSGAGIGGKPAGSAREQLMRALNRRIVYWWLMCVLVTMVHFSLSEAEIRVAKHLWTWLDDYSLHQLNNGTTSMRTLFLMASFDNYIYTVHVYGTRLIGASIICIVCTLQSESIRCLGRQAQTLLRPWLAAQPAGLAGCLHFRPGQSSEPARLARASPREPRPLGSAETEEGACPCECRRPAWLAGCRLGAAAEGQPSSNGPPPLDRGTFFVLAESDWLAVERASREVARRHARHSLPGRLVASLRAQLPALRVGRVLAWSRLARLATGWRQTGASGPPGEPAKLDDGRKLGPQTVVGANPGRVTPWPSESESVPRGPAQSAGAQGRAERQGHSCRRHTAGPTPNWSANWGPEGTRDEDQPPGEYYSSGAHAAAKGRPLGVVLEGQLQQLARKYELIRTVNQRVESCFGQMLLGQYSFLFLMSCIDVVYFSLSFNPNTKTKYIIVSGMILLWWPYLLLYKFASDIATASKELLVSVRRLARLSLVLQLQERRQTIAAATGTCPVNPAEAQLSTSAPSLPAATLWAPEVGGQGGVWSAGSLPGEQSGRLVGKSRLWEGSLGAKWRLRREQQRHLLAAASILRADQRQQQPFEQQSYEQQPFQQQAYQQQAYQQQQQSQEQPLGPRIFNKLDHVFQPCHLSIVGIMVVDKFFLLNFAKIVITASVMTIQFITK